MFLERRPQPGKPQPLLDAGKAACHQNEAAGCLRQKTVRLHFRDGAGCRVEQLEAAGFDGDQNAIAAVGETDDGRSRRLDQILGRS